MNQRRELHFKEAYTMVELLIVIIVIVILAAILVPVFVATRRSANRTTCLSNLHQLGVAMDMYRSDWNALPNTFFDWKMVTSEKDPLEPYSRSPELYHCPENIELRTVRDYLYRVDTLLQLGPKKLMRPDASIVTVYCPNHIRPHDAPPNAHREGLYMVLRADASVKAIPVGATKLWMYQDGKWLPPGTLTFPTGGDVMGWEVFPGENWPPDFE